MAPVAVLVPFLALPQATAPSGAERWKGEYDVVELISSRAHKDDSFGYSTAISGKRVIVQGSLYEKEIDEAAAEHIAGESDGLTAEEIAGKTFEMNVTACVILPEAEATS